MNARIYVDADEAWEYCLSSRDAGDDDIIRLAENEDYGITVYMSLYGVFPVVTVEADGCEILEEIIEDSSECEKKVQAIYNDYLTSNVIDILGDANDGEENKTLMEKLDKIDERELELDNAVWDLINVFVPNLFDIEEDPDEVYEDMKDHISEYLYKKHNISIYRPMFLEEEDGSDYYTNFPYSEMELEEV